MTTTPLISIFLTDQGRLTRLHITPESLKALEGKKKGDRYEMTVKEFMELAKNQAAKPQTLVSE